MRKVRVFGSSTCCIRYNRNTFFHRWLLRKTMIKQAAFSFYTLLLLLSCFFACLCFLTFSFSGLLFGSWFLSTFCLFFLAFILFILISFTFHLSNTIILNCWGFFVFFFFTLFAFIVSGLSIKEFCFQSINWGL